MRFTASPIDKPKKRRIAGYARVSTDHDEQFTNYINSRFLGYNKKLDSRMVINPAEAETVKKIHRLFLEGITPYGISRQLEADGDLSSSHSTKWNATTVKWILSNEKYKGYALLQKTYTVDYLTKKTKVNEGEIPQYYVEGDHEAIIDPAVFDRVQIELEKRCSEKNRHSGVHDFSGKIKCGECSSWYGSKVWHSTDKYRKVIWRCNHKYGGEKCSTPHLTDEKIKAAFVSAANKALTDKETVIETFRLIWDTVFDTSALEQERAELTDELNVVAGLIQDGIYQNAHVVQNQADYNKEYESLAAQYEKTKSRLDEVETEIHDKNSRRKSIEHYLSLLEERKDAVTEYDVYLWHGMVESVTVYSNDDIRFTMKDWTEIRA